MTVPFLLGAHFHALWSKGEGVNDYSYLGMEMQIVIAIAIKMAMGTTITITITITMAVRMMQTIPTRNVEDDSIPSFLQREMKTRDESADHGLSLF